MHISQYLLLVPTHINPNMKLQTGSLDYENNSHICKLVSVCNSIIIAIVIAIVCMCSYTSIHDTLFDYIWNINSQLGCDYNAWQP